MTEKQRDNLALVGFGITLATFLWFLWHKLSPKTVDAIQGSVGNLFSLPPLTVPQLDSGGDIFFDFGSFAGDPFAGIPVAQGANNSCGCTPYQCPSKPYEYATLPPLITAATTAILPPSTFSLSTCAFNPQGYLDANPDVKAAYGTPGELKFRKKNGYSGINGWATYHYNRWGAAEGRSWNC